MWHLRAIVFFFLVASVLSQRERKPSPLPQRPKVFPGVQLSQEEPLGGVAIRRPSLKKVPSSPRIHFNQGQEEIQPATLSQPRTSTTTEQPSVHPTTSQPPFVEEDYEYLDQLDVQDQDYAIASHPESPGNTFFQTPVVQRRFQPQPLTSKAASAKQSPSQTSSRKVLPAKQIIESRQEDKNGRRQSRPTAQIVKSWSTRNADGTFSWGYINTDGSFKNETKGTDCVVRGVYGYLDEATGETLSFPYQTGNPCHPNEPDYYFDYDTGTIVRSGGQTSPKETRNE